MQNTAASTGTSRFPALPAGLATGALPAVDATGTHLTLRRRQRGAV
ncbi:hypothetical protein [Streptomyces spiralis]